MPTREERTDYKFVSERQSYDNARKTCLSHDMRIHCLSSPEDYTTLRRESCGEVWLRGKMSLNVNNKEPVPFYNTSTDSCSDKVYTNCFTGGDGGVKRFTLLPFNEAYFFSLVDQSWSRPFLCSKGFWKPHIFMYPEHISYDQGYQYMLCGLRFTEDAQSKKLKAKWSHVSENGTRTDLQSKSFKNLVSDSYMSSYKASNAGKYICSFQFQDEKDNAVQQTLSGWSYYYTHLNCTVSVDGGEYTSEKEISLKRHMGDTLTVAINCLGYPTPWIITNQREKGGDLSTNTILVNGGTTAIERFAAQIPLADNYTLELNLLPKSVLTNAENIRISISKNPLPPSCSLELVMGSGVEVFKEFAGVIRRESLAATSFTFTVECIGYPMPEISATQRGETDKEVGEREVFGPTERNGSSGAWVLSNFAKEVSVTQMFKKLIQVTVSSPGNNPLLIEIEFVKVLILFDKDSLFPFNNVITGPKKATRLSHEGNPTVAPAEFVREEKTELPCKGKGTGPLSTVTSLWKYNGDMLDFNSELGTQIQYKSPDSFETDATLLIDIKSSVVSGTYTCTIDNGAGNLEYSVTIEAPFPPVTPGQTYIKRIGDVVITAAAQAPSSWSYSNVTKVDGYLYTLGRLVKHIINPDVYLLNGEVVGTFELPAERNGIQISFSGSNLHGSSAESKMSEMIDITPVTPNTSIEGITKSNDSSVPLHSALNLTFDEILGASDYEIRLYDKDMKLISTINSDKNVIVLEDLEPETEYFIDVKGVRVEGGSRIMGPSSLAASFLTAPEMLPAPTGLSGLPLDSDGITSAVLLSWDAPKVVMEGLIAGYNLTYTLQEEAKKLRKRRQALQTIDHSLFIPYGAKAQVVRGLESGKKYSFSLRSFSKDFGESEPATATVETLRSDLCPSVRYTPKHCKPRVSMDSSVVMILFISQECYDGIGLSYDGPVNMTRMGAECAPWAQKHPELLKMKLDPNLKETLGTNYCRNFADSPYKRPWCYTADGTREECYIQSCNKNKDKDCFTGKGFDFRGESETECTPWTDSMMDLYNITEGREILNTTSCRNWDGANMTSPWCINKDDQQAECDVSPCGFSRVNITMDHGSAIYDIPQDSTSVCVPLEESSHLEFWSRQQFGIADCYSEPTEINFEKIQRSTRTIDRLWVRYLLVEGLILSFVILTWVFLFTRKRFISKNESDPCSFLKKTNSSKLSWSSRG